MPVKREVPKLLDIMTRHQIFLEGLKVHQGSLFDKVTLELRSALREAFFDLEVDRLGDITKRQLELFIRRLKAIQLEHFDSYTKMVLDDLERFLKIDSEVNEELLNATQDSSNKAAWLAVTALLTSKGQTRLQGILYNAPIQANGMLPKQFAQRFVDSGQFTLETTMRRAAANKMRPSEALRLIVGSSRLNYRDGLLHRYGYQARALTGTLLQHAAGIVQTATFGEFYEEYKWVSILDRATTPICRERDGKIYRYGKGPLPPAHYGCRSKTVPLGIEEIILPTSYAAWLDNQPASVRSAIVGTNKNATEKFVASSLTLQQFSDSVDVILAT